MTLRKQVEYILEIFPDSRNSDGILVLNLYRKYYYLPDPVSQEKLLEIICYSKPSDIVRVRQQIQHGVKNKDGSWKIEPKYLPTDPRVFEERMKRIKVMRQSLGYHNKPDTL